MKTVPSVAEFQKKLQAAPFWASTGCEEDKKRLLEDNSIWCQNFMKWAEKEADVLSLIEKTMKWRAEVKIYGWNTGQVCFFIQLGVRLIVFQLESISDLVMGQ